MSESRGGKKASPTDAAPKAQTNLEFEFTVGAKNEITRGEHDWSGPEEALYEAKKIVRTWLRNAAGGTAFRARFAPGGTYHIVWPVEVGDMAGSVPALNGLLEAGEKPPGNPAMAYKVLKVLVPLPAVAEPQSLPSGAESGSIEDEQSRQTDGGVADRQEPRRTRETVERLSDFAMPAVPGQVAELALADQVQWWRRISLDKSPEAWSRAEAELRSWTSAGIAGVEQVRQLMESWTLRYGTEAGATMMQLVLDALTEFRFSAAHKKWVASWVNRCLGRIGLLLTPAGAAMGADGPIAADQACGPDNSRPAGTLAVIVGTGGDGSFRLQWTEGRRRFLTLGPVLGKVRVVVSPKGPRAHEL